MPAASHRAIEPMWMAASAATWAEMPRTGQGQRHARRAGQLSPVLRLPGSADLAPGRQGALSPRHPEVDHRAGIGQPEPRLTALLPEPSPSPSPAATQTGLYTAGFTLGAYGFTLVFGQSERLRPATAT